MKEWWRCQAKRVLSIPATPVTAAPATEWDAELDLAPFGNDADFIPPPGLQPETADEPGYGAEDGD